MSLCLCNPVVSSAEEPPAWQLGPLIFRVCNEEAGDYLVVSGYREDEDSTGDIYIKSSYKDIYDRTRKVRGVEEEVFRGKALRSLHMVCDPEVETYTVGANAFRDAGIGLSQGGEMTDCCVIEGGEKTYIGAGAFQGARIRGSITVSMTSGNIGASAFKNMEADGTLKISGAIETIGKEAFADIRVAHLLSLPKSIKHIEERAFAGTKVISSKLLGVQDLQTIGSNIYENCELLEKIVLPDCDSVREVAEDAFPDKEGLTIVIPEGMANLSVFHLENYKNVVYQTPENLTEDSPVLQYLKENKLKYQMGENGKVILPDQSPDPPATPEPTITPTVTPTPTPPETPEPTITPTPTPPETPEPTITPTVTPTATPPETPESTITPTQTPPETSEPTITPTPMVTPPATPEPTQNPTIVPTMIPGAEPTAIPTTPPASVQSPTPGSTDISDKSKEKPVNKKIWVVKNIKYKVTGKSRVVVAGTVSRQIKKLKIPDMVMINGRLYQVVEIGKRAFRGQTKIKTADIGNYVEKVGDEAFAGCRGLTSIQFGTRVKRLGSRVLYQDKRLKKIVFKGKLLNYIGRQTFAGVPRKADIRAKKAMVKKYAKLINQAKK